MHLDIHYVQIHSEKNCIYKSQNGSKLNLEWKGTFHVANFVFTWNIPWCDALSCDAELLAKLKINSRARFREEIWFYTETFLFFILFLGCAIFHCKLRHEDMSEQDDCEQRNLNLVWWKPRLQ